MYRCPFCKLLIRDGITFLQEHRKPFGECETQQEENADDERLDAILRLEEERGS